MFLTGHVKVGGMTYEIKLKRAGEDVITLEVGPDGFRSEDPVHMKVPGETVGAINRMIRIMGREDFEEIEIKKTA